MRRVLAWIAALSCVAFAHGYGRFTSLNSGSIFAKPRVSPNRGDLRVVSSDMLRRPVNMPRRGDLLIRVSGATKAGKHLIALWCVARSGQVDAIKDIKPNQLVYVQEGAGIVRTTQFETAKRSSR